MWVGADTETDNIPVYRNNGSIDLENSNIKTVIIGYTKDGETVKHFKTIDAFMLALSKENFGGDNRRVKPTEIRIFFHNLKFDMSQIIKQWFKWHYDEIENIESVISSNRYYKIDFIYKKVKFVFMDTAKIYPMPLAVIATSLGLEKTKEWDYSKHRNYEDITREEMHYFDSDIKIVYELIKRTYAIGKSANGSNTKLYLTRGSMVLAELKKMRYARTPEHKTEITDKRPDYVKYPDLYINMNVYDIVKFRRAYYGGFVNVAIGKEGKQLTQGISLDYNSMYPSQMRRPMPNWRTMKHFHKPSNYGLEERFKIMRIKITQLNLKKNATPVIPKKSLFGASSNVISIKDLKNREQFFTNWDMDFIEKNYDIRYEYIEVYEFEYIDNVFTGYVDKWGDKKVHATNKFDRQNAKLFLNNGYGKMAQDTLMGGMQKIDEHGNINDEPSLVYVDKDGAFRLRENDELVDKIETPNILVAIAITAYARHELFKAIEAVKKSKDYTYYYADTDAVHVGIPYDIMMKMINSDDEFTKQARIIGSRLGIAYDENEFLHWKIESFFTEAKYLRPKTYAEMNSITGNNETRVAGVNKNGQDLFFNHHKLTDFKLGITMKTLQSAQVSNGTMLYEINKRIG